MTLGASALPQQQTWQSNHGSSAFAQLHGVGTTVEQQDQQQQPLFQQLVQQNQLLQQALQQQQQQQQALLQWQEVRYLGQTCNRAACILALCSLASVGSMLADIPARALLILRMLWSCRLPSQESTRQLFLRHKAQPLPHTPAQAQVPNL
jgi:hypothetical protein